jgi:hypothetical protein
MTSPNFGSRCSSPPTPERCSACLLAARQRRSIVAFTALRTAFSTLSRLWRPLKVEIPKLRGSARSAWALAISTSATTRPISACSSRTTGNDEGWALPYCSPLCVEFVSVARTPCERMCLKKIALSCRYWLASDRRRPQWLRGATRRWSTWWYERSSREPLSNNWNRAISSVQLDQAVLGRTGAMNCTAFASGSIVQLGQTSCGRDRGSTR